eukprot:gene8986-1085_t
MNLFLAYHELRIPIELKEDSTVQDLCDGISKITSIDASKLQLFFKSNSLNNEKTLKEENLQNNDLVTFKIKDELQETYEKIIKEMRKNFATGKTHSLQFRLTQLKNLKKMMEENEEEFKKALGKDLRVPEIIMLNEIILSSVNEIDSAISNLSSWMEPVKGSLPIAHQPASAHIHSEPFGLVLLISPWNYPVSLIIKPLIGIISGGNSCIIKPSEVSENTCKVFSKLLPKYLDNGFYKCIEGGPKETTSLLKNKFDYILYTGNTFVGKIIMEAAAKHLTPVTLELGGKSPCIVLKDCDIDVTAKRIAWGKFFNCGQTCIAVDYILAEKSIEEKLYSKIVENIEAFYGKNAKESNAYSRIINKRHTERLSKLLPKDIAYGGDVDADDHYLSPTILRNVKKEDEVMKDEIFGPILPIIPIESFKEAVDFINERPKPLALYLFTTNEKAQNQIVQATSSGAVSINEVLMHFTIGSLPFGGVGDSGMGAYGGKFSFDTFTHKKGVLNKSTKVDPKLRYPPYTKASLAWLQTFSAPTLGGIVSTFFSNGFNDQ